jgi:predicted DNA-binding transcriptional regulator AlpA
MCLVLLSTKSLAQMLGVSVTTIKKLRATQSDQLPPHIKIGSSYKYDQQVVIQWLNSQQQKKIVEEADPPQMQQAFDHPTITTN